MKSFAKKLKDSTFCNETGGRSAALAYYLLFSVFPVIGVFNIVFKSYGNKIYRFMHFLPPVTADIVGMYIDYISLYPETIMLSAVSFAFFYMPFRAVKFILWDMRKVYGINDEMHFIKRNMRVFIYTLIMLIVFAFTVIVVVISGDMVVALLGEPTGIYIKYITPCAAMFILLVFVFKTGVRKDYKKLYKGAAASAVLWHTGSIAFSVYINVFNKYSIVYGSLGTVMAFMVWVYFSSFCVLLGTRINCVLSDERKGLT